MVLIMNYVDLIVVVKEWVKKNFGVLLKWFDGVMIIDGKNVKDVIDKFIGV